MPALNNLSRFVGRLARNAGEDIVRVQRPHRQRFIRIPGGAVFARTNSGSTLSRQTVPAPQISFLDPVVGFERMVRA